MTHRPPCPHDSSALGCAFVEHHSHRCHCRWTGDDVADGRPTSWRASTTSTTRSSWSGSAASWSDPAPSGASPGPTRLPGLRGARLAPDVLQQEIVARNVGELDHSRQRASRGQQRVALEPAVVATSGQQWSAVGRTARRWPVTRCPQVPVAQAHGAAQAVDQRRADAVEDHLGEAAVIVASVEDPEVGRRDAHEPIVRDPDLRARGGQVGQDSPQRPRHSRRGDATRRRRRRPARRARPRARRRWSVSVRGLSRESTVELMSRRGRHQGKRLGVLTRSRGLRD